MRVPCRWGQATRARQLPAALAELERAAELRPELPRYSYVLAVALNDVGQSDRALVVLRTADERHPGDRAIRGLLAQLEQAEASEGTD